MGVPRKKAIILHRMQNELQWMQNELLPMQNKLLPQQKDWSKVDVRRCKPLVPCRLTGIV